MLCYGHNVAPARTFQRPSHDTQVRVLRNWHQPLVNGPRSGLNGYRTS